MKTLELIGKNYIGQSELEEIGNRFYERVTELYRNIVGGLEGIYNGIMAYGREEDNKINEGYGQKNGRGKGKGKEESGRRNVNKNPCSGDGPGYSQGGGRGNGRGRR